MRVVYQFEQVEIDELVTLLREAIRWGRRLANDAPMQAERGYLPRVAQVEAVIDKIQSRSVAIGGDLGRIDLHSVGSMPPPDSVSMQVASGDC